jgi:hypothetical protein
MADEFFNGIGRTATVDDQTARVQIRRSMNGQHQPVILAARIARKQSFALVLLR